MSVRGRYPHLTLTLTLTLTGIGDVRGRGVSTGPTLPPRPTPHPCPAPEQEREQQALGTEGKLLHRQEQELKALRKRITSGAEEQRQARQQDLERLLQRCHHLPPT